jgi:hypothetical protein
MTKNDKNLLKQMIEAGKFSYEMYELLVVQNKANSKAMIKRMGNKWVCAKINHVKKLEVPLDILEKNRSKILSQYEKSKPKN